MTVDVIMCGDCFDCYGFIDQGKDKVPSEKIVLKKTKVCELLVLVLILR